MMGESKMKQWIWGIILGGLCAGASANNAYRDFTNIQGQTVRARISSFDAKKGIVQLEPEKGKKARVPLSALIEQDREYVRIWGNANNFMNKSRFRVSVDRSREKNDEISGYFNPNPLGFGGNHDREVKNVWYDITLDNHSDNTLTNVQLEYCIFYEQEGFKVVGDKVVCDQGIYCGRVDVAGIEVGSEKILHTAKVMIFKSELGDSWSYTSGAKNTRNGQVHGLWLRASVALPDGERVYRDVIMPDSLSSSRHWTTKPINAGINR